MILLTLVKTGHGIMLSSGAIQEMTLQTVGNMGQTGNDSVDPDKTKKVTE